MIATSDIVVHPVSQSKLHNLQLENIPFGKHFTDHMLVAEYRNGAWGKVVIEPFNHISISPSLSALHYGQSIFEGVKAYRLADGQTAIFRPYDNFKRFNLSAERMCMPTVPEDIFIDGMKQLVALDAAWVPQFPDHSLYIRPFMFASEDAIGVKPSDSYLFMILLSPTGPYFMAPMRIYVEEQLVRAAPGGVGFAKTAGNYAAAMYASAQAKKAGYDQVLWTDALEHKYVQEIGVMNVFFIINNTAITPSLDEGTILEGVTRASVITVLQEMGLDVEERRISIDEVVEAYQNGTLREVFGTGTAATIAFIKELKYKETTMQFDTPAWQIAPQVKSTLYNLRYGLEPDTHGWLELV
ncbi:MAG: branched-chain amino acid aminotransferase [Bacteroidetes bacterium]|nr:MAG: branched-chain amino acid aminotransferase [Bacteroidota bacterium]